MFDQATARASARDASAVKTRKGEMEVYESACLQRPERSADCNCARIKSTNRSGLAPPRQRLGLRSRTLGSAFRIPVRSKALPNARDRSPKIGGSGRE